MNFLQFLFPKKPFNGADARFSDYNLTRNKKDRPVFCHAPFKSLYFGQGGNVKPCCYNRSYIYSSINEQSIDGIWNGEKIKAIRKALKNNNLSFGCYVCKQHLFNENYSFVGALNYDTLPAASTWPSIIEFECDNTCNLECIMCTGEFSSAILLNREHLPLETNPYNENFTEQLLPYLKNLCDAKFNGGEPFLSPLYFKIWNDILNVNPSCTISIQTNATILNDTVKDFLNRGRFNISVSLDALNKDLYESIRKNANFDKVIENINFFRDYCKNKNTYFGISVCPMRNNWKEMPSLVQFANKNEALIHFHSVWYPPALALWNLDSSTLNHIHAYLDRYKWAAHSELERKNIYSFRQFIAQIDQWHTEAKKRETQAHSANDAHTLKQLIIEKVHKWCDNAYADATEKKLKKEKYTLLIEETSALFVQEELISCYKNILNTPVEFIVMTLETENKSKILARFKSFIF